MVKDVSLNLPPKETVLLFVPLAPLQRLWYERLLNKADKGIFEEIFSEAKGKEEAALQEETPIQDWERKNLDELEQFDHDGAAHADWDETKRIMEESLKREATEDKKTSAWQRLMNLLLQLRKCCNHPYILPDAAPDSDEIGEHLISASGKFIVLEKLINRLVINEGKKILIFSGFTKMLDLCEDLLRLRGGNGELFRFLRLE